MRSKCVFLSGNAFKNALKENENNSRCDNKNLKNLRYEVNIKEKITSKALRVCLNFGYFISTRFSDFAEN